MDQTTDASLSAAITDAPPSKLFLIVFVCALFVTGGLNWIGGFRDASFIQAPIFVAPCLTIAVAIAVLAPYMVNKGLKSSDNWTSIGVAAITIILCEILALAHTWYLHLLVMMLLFSLFIFWDIKLARSVRSTDLRSEIINGSKFINIPTLVILVIALLFLCLLQFFGPDNLNVGSYRSSFVTGLVTFHLGVSSVSYFLVSNPTLMDRIFTKQP